MILTDREIQVALRTNQVRIDPEPKQEKYSSSSLDLTLGQSIRTWRMRWPPGVEAPIMCPGAPDYQYSQVVKELTEEQRLDDYGYLMEPNDFVLGWTEERIDLPAHSRIAARVEGKSSLARLGIGVHVTAPTIHAGFSGVIQLELTNVGPLRVRLVPGMPLCQVIFEQTLGTPDKGYQGQFQAQEAG
ncbi:MAG TPA: dCTP deaminase [Chthonomonadales bacterium]|nr:dCTP deaminase [Chthonomonadales bacterium]